MRKLVVISMLLLAGVAVVSYFSGVERLSLVAGFFLFCLALGISFLRGTDALYLIVFAMLFSPEIGPSLATGRTAGEGASISVRLEDLLLVAVGVGWLLRTAYQRRHFGILKTRINTPIMLYMSVAILSTTMGVLRGAVEGNQAIFHNAKIFEYFFLFFMITAHVRDHKTVRKMLIAMILVFVMALVYGYFQIGTGSRVVAPFDQEPNTFGGYIVLMICMCLGMSACHPSFRTRWIFAGVAVFAVPPLLFTLSRASYMGLVFGMAAFVLVSRYRVIAGAVFIALLCASVLGVSFLPEATVRRVTSTFEKGTEYHVQVAGVDFDPSTSARLVSYGKALERWVERPLFGHGLTGTHFIDGQFFRVLAEMGIVGFGAFLFLIWRLLSAVYLAYKQLDDALIKGAAMGLFCGIVAILGHALSANSFVIIRIAEPLWMLAGLILVTPFLDKYMPDDCVAAETGGATSRAVPVPEWSHRASVSLPRER